MEIEWACHVLAMGKPRPRVTRSGAYMPQAYRDCQDELRNSALEAFARHIARGASWDVDALMAVELAFVLPDRRRRDLDNLAGGVLDALNKVAWRDDSQVVELVARKLYVPRAASVTIRLRALPNE